MIKLKNLSIDDTKQYIRDGLLTDSDCDMDFWLNDSKEKHELLLNNVTINEMINGLLLTPHNIVKNIEYMRDHLKPYMVEKLYSVLEMGRMKLSWIHELLDPLRLKPEYFYSKIEYKENMDHLLSVMYYDDYIDNDDVDHVIELHKRGLGSITSIVGDMDTLRKLHTNGIMVDSSVSCNGSIANLLEIINMGYSQIDKIYGVKNIDDITPEIHEICSRYFSNDLIVSSSIHLDITIPDYIVHDTLNLSLSSVDELEKYALRTELHNGRLRPSYDGLDIPGNLPELFSQYSMVIKDVNLACHILEEYPSAQIRVSDYCSRTPPTNYYPNGARRLIGNTSENNIRIIKYLIEHYSNYFNVRVSESNRFFIN